MRWTGRLVAILLVVLLGTTLVVAGSAGSDIAAAAVGPVRHGRKPKAPVVLRLRFHEVANQVSSFASDGRYVLVASPAGGTVLIDDRTGSRTVLAPPALCGYTYFVGGGWVLTMCAGSGPPYELYSIATGTWAAVNSTGAMPVAIGTDWIEYYGPVEYGCTVHCTYQYSFGNIATGQIQTLPEWTPGGTAIPDLNSPVLIGQLCSPLQVPQGFPEEETGLTDSPDSLTFAGPFAVGIQWYQPGDWQDRLVLERCGSRLRRVLANPSDTEPRFPQFAINRNIVVWLNYESVPIRGVFLPSLRKFTVPVPSRFTLSTGDSVFLTSHTLYVEDGAGHLLEASAPRRPRDHRRHRR